MGESGSYLIAFRKEDDHNYCLDAAGVSKLLRMALSGLNFSRIEIDLG